MNANMRIIYPLTDFQLELSLGIIRILTIGTLNEINVSFTSDHQGSQEMATH